MLYSYYGPMNVKSDEIFPRFIIEVLPPGITGIIIAGLFAAAMSTLAGSMSSISSSTMIDIIFPFFGKNFTEEKKLKTSRLLTIFWAFLLIVSALLFKGSSQAVVEIALSIASFTYGGLLGTFLLGLIFKKVKQKDAVAGFIAGIVFMITIISLKIVAWTWFTLIGVLATVLVGIITSFIYKKSKTNGKIL